LSLRISLLAVAAVGALAVISFVFLQHRLSSPLLGFGLDPEVVESLEDSLADQRTLAGYDGEHETAYRERFAALETLLQRLYVLEHSRDAIVRRYDAIVLALTGVLAIAVVGAFAWHERRKEARLQRLQAALADLAAGRTDIEVGFGGRDVVGRIAHMVEETSQVMARDRRRLAALQNLSAWQEAARRHAHEMRTPLTGARLELTRLATLIENQPLDHREEIEHAARSAGQEVERLGTFAQQFTSFARLPRPELRRQDLGALLGELTTTFAAAWPNLTLILAADLPALEVVVDRDMLRQVLVNLCDNVAQSIDKPGRVEISYATQGNVVAIRVADDGPGISESVRPRLFEPYTTTRSIGQGMGLGLAISRKILLDHDGDLELETTSEAGTTFRLTLPRSRTEGEA
jgi:two-component system nitrogen regulation sensor histidine kinase NtrY